jgi:hypothetical protein
MQMSGFTPTEIKKQIHNHWTKRLIDEAGTKSSLTFLDINNLKIGKTHNIWNHQTMQMSGFTPTVLHSLYGIVNKLPE